MITHKPLLIIGATGVIGNRTVRTLREMHPSAPLLLASRDLPASETLAQEIGNASAVQVDMTLSDLGLPPELEPSVVAMFFKDDSLNSLRFAQAKRAAYMDISSAVFEMGPEVAWHVQNPHTPVLMASNWLAGTSTGVALHFAKQFKTVQSIIVSALLDEKDIGGAAANVDYERQTGAVTSALVLKDSRWRWLDGDHKNGSFKSTDGHVIASQAFSNMDVLSLAAATDAQNVTFEFAVGMTASRRRGQRFSHEIIITIEGAHSKEGDGSFRYEVVHPEGQAPMTALSAAIAIERLANLDGKGVVVPGLYLPHKLIEPTYIVEKLLAAGTAIRAV